MRSLAPKIAVVAPRYGLVGGFEKFTFELTERIAMNPEYEIHVFANRWKAGSDRVRTLCGSTGLGIKAVR